MAETESSDLIHVPGKRPEFQCYNRGPRYRCNRRSGHTGRHAYIWWSIGGRVRDVWGER